ncbi:hypothetical protein NQ315_004024 [Exocentrus adspersus]|uniref:Uncharacterized protein n=1 Tax=Exocentrus adspersus TaxID=1586481 RepID=A0AAV8W6Z1_9CUCU|nr:hypothetical protein NQ315_004024 [Exocentrus adspersus]
MFPTASLVCYTDESPLREKYPKAGLGKYNRHTEVFAILMVAQREDVQKCVEEEISICPDSQAVFKAISSPRTRSIFVEDFGDVLIFPLREDVGNLYRIKYAEGDAWSWVPRHVRIPVNETEDQLHVSGHGSPIRDRNQSSESR